jgi:hypothetical protein
VTDAAGRRPYATKRIPRPPDYAIGQAGVGPLTEAQLDAWDAKHIIAEVRSQPPEVVVRVDCFSDLEADRLRALLPPDVAPRVFFTWVFGPPKAPPA